MSTPLIDRRAFLIGSSTVFTGCVSAASDGDETPIRDQTTEDTERGGSYETTLTTQCDVEGLRVAGIGGSPILARGKPPLTVPLDEGEQYMLEVQTQGWWQKLGVFKAAGGPKITVHVARRYCDAE